MSSHEGEGEADPEYEKRMEIVSDHIVEIFKHTKDLSNKKRVDVFWGILHLTRNYLVQSEIEARISKRDEWQESFTPRPSEIAEVHEKLIKVISCLSYLPGDDSYMQDQILEIFSTINCWHDSCKGKGDSPEEPESEDKEEVQAS